MAPPSGFSRIRSDSTVDVSAVGHGLAARAPEGDARVGALNAAANRLAAAAAGLAVAAVDPEARAGVGLVGGAALAAADK